MPAASAVMGVIGVGGGIGLGVDGYEAAGNDVVVCNPPGVPGIRGCSKNNSIFINFHKGESCRQ